MATPLNILVVEDESLIAEMVRVMLEDMGHRVPFVAYNYKTAARFLEEEEVGFAVFDINLKEGSEGIDLAKMANEMNIPFMFLTSYSDKATIDAAKVTKPGAYVIKPFSEEELYSGIEMSLMHLSPKKESIVKIKDGHRNIVIKTADIIFAKADNVYVEIYTTSKRHLVRQSLTAFTESFSCRDFIRVHRSFVVNKNFITTHSRSSIQLGDFEVPISRTYKEDVLLQLEG
ncbi:MAG: response regulator transcription factor [Flavobacteriales bacterium]|nr:response regulator transcription factor [Flavobacteriales bacterium]